MRHSIHITIILLICCQNIFSQEKYHFDNYVVSNVKNYKSGYTDKLIEIFNHKDSTYTLQIQYKNNKRKALLFDYKNKKINLFIMDFDFKRLSSIKKLDNPFQKYNPNLTNKKDVQGKEIVEFENDTIKNTKIVHLTNYKDEDKSLILNEYYYFFSLKKEMNFDESVNLKLKLIKKFNIEFKDDENLYRILSLKDGKIMVDTEFLSYVNEEVDFKFDVASQQTKNIFIQQGE